MAQFDWVDFYEAFAKALLNYKDNRSALIQTIKKIYEEIEINLPTLEQDNQIVDIDPFTVFGLFNKSKLKESNRVKIIVAFFNSPFLKSHLRLMWSVVRLSCSAFPSVSWIYGFLSDNQSLFSL